MSISLESSKQLARERFRLDKDQELSPLLLVDRRISHVRSLEVTVSLEPGQTTEVAFTQTVQFPDSSRTNALLFPPVGKYTSPIGVHFQSHDHAVGKASLTVVDEARTFSSIYDRLWCSVKSASSGTILTQGYVMDNNGKTITIGNFNDERNVFAWPSTRIVLCYDKPPFEYGVCTGGTYVLVQTEHPMNDKEDIHLDYSLENALTAEMQYNVALLVGTGVCTFDTTYTVRNTRADIVFDGVNRLRIVDSTKRVQLKAVAERSVPTAYFEAAPATPRYLAPTSSAYSSLVRPVDFVYDQTIGIGAYQSIELFNGEPAVVPCLLSYRSSDLYPYMADVASVSTVLWFDIKSLTPLMTRGAQTKVAITHADTRTSVSSFYWNRKDDDAKYVFSEGKDWLPKTLDLPSNDIRIENDGVEESSTGKLLRFHASSFLHEDAVIAFPIFPNQVEGRCLSVEIISGDSASEDELHDQPWSTSALPQLYAIFNLGAGKRLNFLARFSLGSQ